MIPTGIKEAPFAVIVGISSIVQNARVIVHRVRSFAVIVEDVFTVT